MPTSTRSLGYMLMGVFLGAVAMPLAAHPEEMDEPTGDWAKLNGTWEVTAYTDNGKPVDPSGDLRNRRDVFKEGKWTLLYMGKQNAVMNVNLDSTKSPAEIDIERTSGSGKGLKQKGIYKVQDGMLTICLSGVRPTEFESKAGSGRILVVLKRVD